MASPLIGQPKAVSRVKSEDPALNLFQDQLLAVLNPFMKQIAQAVGATPQVDSASLPAPSASVAGQVYRVKDPGKQEVLKVCLAGPTGAYAWSEVGAGANRATAWANLGVWVGPTAPAVGITYAEWLAGADGYWGWKSIP